MSYYVTILNIWTLLIQYYIRGYQAKINSIQFFCHMNQSISVPYRMKIQSYSPIDLCLPYAPILPSLPVSDPVRGQAGQKWSIRKTWINLAVTLNFHSVWYGDVLVHMTEKLELVWQGLTPQYYNIRQLDDACLIMRVQVFLSKTQSNWYSITHSLPGIQKHSLKIFCGCSPKTSLIIVCRAYP